MGQSRGNSGVADPFSNGGHRTGSDSAAINAAVWELSDRGQHPVSVREIARRAALGGGWQRADDHLDCWHDACGLKGRLPSGQRFRPDRIGQGEECDGSSLRSLRVL